MLKLGLFTKRDIEPEPDRPEFWLKPDGLHFVSIRPDGFKTLGKGRERERERERVSN